MRLRTILNVKSNKTYCAVKFTGSDESLEDVTEFAGEYIDRCWRDTFEIRYGGIYAKGFRNDYLAVIEGALKVIPQVEFDRDWRDLTPQYINLQVTYTPPEKRELPKIL